MTMTVSGPGGVSVDFPDGTDPATIDKVMSEATGASPKTPDQRIAGAFDASQPVRQVNGLVEPRKGLVTDRNRFGDVSLGGYAGDVLGGTANTVNEAGKAFRTGDTSPQAIASVIQLGLLGSPASAAAQAGERAIPGVAQALRREAPAVPTSDALRAAGSAGFDAARQMGVDYHPGAVAQMASTVRAGLENDGINSVVAPKSFRLLQMLEQPPSGSGASLSGLITARKAFGNAAKDFTNPTEQLAAKRIIDQIDAFTEAPPAGSVVAGPAADAGTALADARGNYAAGMRSRSFAGKQDQANLSAAASNSGANADNALRQRVRDVLKSDKASAGYSADELAAMTQFVQGTRTRNLTRRIANLLGGGGGLGSVVTGMAGVGAGGYALGPYGALAGAAVPIAGWGTKAAQNAMARSAMQKIDEQIRQRSPLYQQMQAGAPVMPVSPAARAALAKALLLAGPGMLGPPLNNGGGGY